jgi:DNA polymerase I
MSSKQRAILVDGNALIHRGWHALPPMTDPQGHMVQAVYGMASVLMKLLPMTHPAYFAVCWDTPEPTYRHTAEPAYKAQRVEQPQEFYDQFPGAKQMVEALGGRNVELPGYEADDLLATLATKLAQEGIEVTIVTSDRDVWQLIGPRIEVMAFKKGVTETMTYTPESLAEVTGGLTPAQIIDFKAMCGDASDNLKGVPGIGEKTATDLLLKYGTLEKIFEAAHDAQSDLSPAIRKKLLEGEAAGRATQHLVRLVSDAPVAETVQDLKRSEVAIEDVKKVFLTFGFQSLVARLDGTSSKKEKKVVKEEKEEAPTLKKRKGKTTQIAVKELETGVKRQTLTTEKEALAFLREVDTTAGIVVRPIMATQGSLFAENVGLVLGFADATVMIPRTVYQKSAVKEQLAKLLQDPSTKIMGHDLKAAWHWCRKEDLEMLPNGFDTEIVAFVLAAGEGGYALEPLAAAKLGRFLPEGDMRPLAEAEVIRALAEKLEQELQVDHLDRVYERFERPLISILGAMEEQGVTIHVPYFKELAHDFRAQKELLEKEMNELAGEVFNPGSPSQLAHILFEVLKIPSKGIKRGKTGFSTAASELEKLEGQHLIVEKIGMYREVAKLLSTYVEALPALADAQGRVHTTYHQSGAATGRLSSTDPNLQNIPIRTEIGRKIRRGFVAEKGWSLVSCDYSQIQLRIVAALAKDEKMLSAFRQGIDVHTATAANIWKVPLSEVTVDQRRAAKTINFGVLYGQGPVALSKGAGISFAEAKEFIKKYFEVYSGVREYLETIRALAHAQGYVETLFGRRRPIPDIDSPLPMLRAAAERMAANMPIQGTEADLMKLGLISVAQHLPSLSTKARLLLTVHDELVLEVPEDEVKDLAPKIIDLMQSVTDIGCPIVVEAKAGPNWEDMKKIA